MSFDPNDIMVKQDMERARRAVELKMITPEQVAECREEQGKWIEMGEERHLGKILIEKGYVDMESWKNIDLIIDDEEMQTHADLPVEHNKTHPGPLPEDYSLAKTQEMDSVPEDKEIKGSEQENSFDFSGELLPDGMDYRTVQKQKKKEFEDKKLWPNIPGYEILSVLGKGAMGTVYQGMQISMQRKVAIKVLDKKLSKNMEFVERFTRETRAVAQLNHENIIGGIDAGKTEDDIHFFVMEFIEGKSLNVILNEEGKFSSSKALNITLQISQVLQHAYKNGIIHRDIKPENIMMAGSTAKLCDLGLAKDESMDSQLTMAGVTLGTPHYISPEQARGEKGIDIRSDIYSLGASLYHMVVGDVPFPKKNATVVCMMHATEPLPDPRVANPDVPPEICRIIKKCTEKPKNKRFQTPDQLTVALEECWKNLRAEEPGQPASPLTERPGQPTQAKTPAAQPKPPSTGLDFIPLDSEERKRVARHTQGHAQVASKRMRKVATTGAYVQTPQENHTPLIVGVIIGALVVLVGIGYLVYPLVENLLIEKKRKTVNEKTVITTNTREKKQKAIIDKEIENVNKLFQYFPLDNENHIKDRNNKYKTLLEKHHENPFVKEIAKEQKKFQTSINTEAKKIYNSLKSRSQVSLNSYQKDKQAKYLREAFDILNEFPAVFRRHSNTADSFTENLAGIEKILDQTAEQDIIIAKAKLKEKQFREAWNICQKIKQYSLPKHEKEIAPIAREANEKYLSIVKDAEAKYGKEFTEKFHHAVLKGQYRQALNLCKNYRNQEKYYGLWNRIDEVAISGKILGKIEAKFKKTIVLTEKEKITLKQLTEFLPELNSLNENNKSWLTGLLFMRVADWQNADNYFQKLPKEFKGRKIYLDYTRKQIQEQIAETMWDELRIAYSKKQYVKTRNIIDRLTKNYSETIFIKKKQVSMRRTRKKIDDAYLKKYALPLFFNGRFQTIPDSKNGYAFIIKYQFSKKEREDFKTLLYGSNDPKKHKNGWPFELRESNGLFEAYWKVRPQNIEKIELKITPGKNPTNLGLILYKQFNTEKNILTQKTLLDQVSALNRYLYLFYFDPNQMCRGEIYNKAKVYWEYDHPQYKKILGQKLKTQWRTVLCLTEGNAGYLCRKERFDNMIKQQKELDKENLPQVLTARVIKSGEIQFDLFKHNFKRFNKGYLGLYAGSDVVFEKLTISGKFSKELAKEIEIEVKKNKTLYLKKKPYWSDY